MLNLSIKELSNKLKTKQISSLELTKASLDRINTTDSKLKAFLHVAKEEALDAAKIVDKKIANGEKISVLAGIPMAVKDNICTKGIKTTCASKLLKDFVPPYDATVMKNLNEKNVIMIGKTNLDEFAMGGSTENSAFEITKNPWDLERVPGGSSGGSAVAVSSNQVVYSLGSDTGGSVRQPAAFNGIIGLKPTYGRISRYGLVAFASSLDQIGIFTKNIEDCAIVLEEIAGKDQMDSTSADIDVDSYSEYISKPINGMKIAVPRELMQDGVQEDIKNALKSSIEKLEELGAVVEEISLENLKHSVETYYIIAPSEASSNLSRYDGIRFGDRAKEFKSLEDLYIQSRTLGFGDEVKRRIMIGTYTLSAGYYDAYYKKALQVRTLIKRDFEEAFKKYDVILTPTTPNTAFKIGEKINNPLAMYLEDICTIPVNMAGLPGISIPCGFDKNAMPIGMQFISKAFDEKTLFKVASAYQNATDYHKKSPKL